jgi:hypothetical protein
MRDLSNSSERELGNVVRCLDQTVLAFQLGTKIHIGYQTRTSSVKVQCVLLWHVMTVLVAQTC